MRCGHCGLVGTVAKERCWRCGEPLAAPDRPRLRISGSGALPFPPNPEIHLRAMEGFSLPQAMLPALAPATATALRPQSAPRAAPRPPPDLARVSEALAAAMAQSEAAPTRQPRHGMSWRYAAGTVLLAAGAVLGGAGSWWLHETEPRPHGRPLPLGALAVTEPSGQAALPDAGFAGGGEIASLSVAAEGEERLPPSQTLSSQEMPLSSSPGLPDSGIAAAAGPSEDTTPQESGHEGEPGETATEGGNIQNARGMAGATARRGEPSPPARAGRAVTSARPAPQGAATDAERPSKPAPRTPAAPRSARAERHARNLPALCADAGNFFRREQCKWRVCDGHWGQHGCPPPARNNPA